MGRVLDFALIPGDNDDVSFAVGDIQDFAEFAVVNLTSTRLQMSRIFPGSWVTMILFPLPLEIFSILLLSVLTMVTFP